MSTQVVDGPDCTNHCRSVKHGDIITSAISKRNLSDFQLCALLNYVCACCESVKDSSGRTALHMAASCGRLELAKWLVQCRHANINVKDDESGYTALHRSLFYGKLHVAVELMKLGANVGLLDPDNLLPLEHVMKDSLIPDEHIHDGELYVWGSNANNCLGPQQARLTPELLDVFHKEHPNECVSQVLVDKFHSIIVTGSGKVYSCGHGQGGRLGLGIENTIVTPKLILFPENNQELLTCVDASISRDHSVFLMSDGNVYTCGLNVHKVLGIVPPPEQVLRPRQIKHLSKEIKGVCSGRYHSVAWGPNALYTWGLNAGQLGHKINNVDHYVVSPRLAGMLNISGTAIKLVECSDGATAVYTEKGDVYVLHEYQCRKIASRQLNLVQLSIIGGKLNSSIDKELSNESNKELRVAALTNHGNILLWQESDPQLCRCIFALRSLTVKQIKIHHNGILFTTKDGEAFQGTIKPRKKKVVEKSVEKNVLQKFLEKDLCIFVKLTKFPRIHRAISITSDPLGHDFCVIQAYPYKNFQFPEIAQSEMENHFHLLLDEAHETDGIHDLVFKVGNTYFPAHRYIVSLKSPYLEKLMLSTEDEIIVLKDFNPVIFEQFLLYAYTGTCDLVKCGPCPEKLLNCAKKAQQKQKTDEKGDGIKLDENISAFEYYSKTKEDNKTKDTTEKTRNPVRMLQEMAKKLGCSDLQNLLSHFDMTKSEIKQKMNDVPRKKPLKFDRSQYSDLHDVVVKCSDGKEIRAHKCVLAARMEYFNNMFSMRWHGKDTSEISVPFPKSIAEALLEYVYTDTLACLNHMEVDHLFKVLVLADQLFVIRLKEQCEQLLTNQLTIKNCVQLLMFADTYNADSLKKCCMKFIISNLAPVLELRLLDNVGSVLLKELSDLYFHENRQLWCRVITPYSTALPDEEILCISEMFPVALDQEVEKTVQKTTQKRRSRSHKNSSSDNNFKHSPEQKQMNNDSLIQFPDTVEEVHAVEESPVCVRLNAIKLAHEKINEDIVELQFTKLKSSRSISFSNNESTISISPNSGDFPELSSPPTSHITACSKSPHKPDVFRHKVVKMSQKQRKRLSSESISKEEIKVPESPKNPWKVIPSVDNSPQLSNQRVNIDDIMFAEKKQKENLVKLQSKVLIHRQMEDKAIDELHRFYNTENVEDEIITIERVDCGAVAVPTWVPRNK